MRTIAELWETVTVLQGSARSMYTSNGADRVTLFQSHQTVEEPSMTLIGAPMSLTVLCHTAMGL